MVNQYVVIWQRLVLCAPFLMRGNVPFSLIEIEALHNKIFLMCLILKLIKTGIKAECKIIIQNFVPHS